jgi:hypothetical protein
MADKPLWRQAFDAVDRRVSGPAERAVGSDAFHDALALGLRLQARVRGRVERESRRALHLLNLPSNTDVRRLSEQVAALRRELRELERRS